MCVCFIRANSGVTWVFKKNDVMHAVSYNQDIKLVVCNKLKKDEKIIEKTLPEMSI